MIIKLHSHSSKMLVSIHDGLCDTELFFQVGPSAISLRVQFPQLLQPRSPTFRTRLHLTLRGRQGNTVLYQGFVYPLDVLIILQEVLDLFYFALNVGSSLCLGQVRRNCPGGRLIDDVGYEELVVEPERLVFGSDVESLAGNRKFCTKEGQTNSSACASGRQTYKVYGD